MKRRFLVFIGVSENFGVGVVKNEIMMKQVMTEQADRRGGTACSRATNWQFEGLDWQARRFRSVSTEFSTRK